MSRIEGILLTAIENEAENIVLGAFGCGAFRNPPYLVARAFKEELNKYKNHFENIIFATLVHNWFFNVIFKYNYIFCI